MKRSIVIAALFFTATASANSRIGGNVSIKALVQGSMVAENGVTYVGVVGDNANVGGSVTISAVVTESIVTQNNGVTKIACVDKDTAGSVSINVVVSSIINIGKGDVKVGCAD